MVMDLIFNSTFVIIFFILWQVYFFLPQVLHLMNKMDLPAPFGAVTSAPPVVNFPKYFFFFCCFFLFFFDI